MKKLLFVCLMCLIPVSSFAANEAPNTSAQYQKNSSSTNAYNLLEGVALNAAASARTITLKTRGWSRVNITVFLTRTAATTLTATFSGSIDGTNYAPQQSRKISNGASTLNDLVDTKSVSGNDEIMIEYDVSGLQGAQILFGGASGGASDLINVQAVLVAGY